MIGTLNNQITSNIRNKLHSACITILIKAYELAKSDPVFLEELEEDVYTAVLVGKYMQKVPLKYHGKWFIAPQVPYYTEEHLDGLTSPSEAPRPDIRFEKYVLSNPESFKFTIEAKKLKASSSKLKRRYLTTGISNFLSGRYPDGCLAAYVIKCKSNDCILGINRLLIKDKRQGEVLTNGNSVEGHEEVYHSHHENDVLLKHIFLEFP
jgi:hypothetical protein